MTQKIYIIEHKEKNVFHNIFFEDNVFFLNQTYRQFFSIPLCISLSLLIKNKSVKRHLVITDTKIYL